MQIIYQIREDDYKNAAWLAMRKRSIFQSFRFYWVAGISVFFIAASIIPALIARNYESLWGALFGLVMLYVVIFGQTTRFRKQYRKSMLLQLRNTLYVDNSSLRFEAVESDSRANWKAYSRFFENSKTFILFQGDQTFVPIPKRELDPDQITELRTLFETHLSRK